MMFDECLSIQQMLSAISWHGNCIVSVMDNGSNTKTKDFLLKELERELERSLRALEQVPAGKYAWKPHERSMMFGDLANIVATTPTWITMPINPVNLMVLQPGARWAKVPAIDGPSADDKQSH
jgi:hypothetical protein